MFLITQGVRQDSLTLLTGVGGPYEAVSAKPYIGPITPTDLTVLADLTAVDNTFTGGAAKVITWSGQIVSANRQWFVESQLLLWIATALTNLPQSVYGVYYYTGADLIGVDPFDAPVLIDEVGDSCQIIATVP